MTPVDSFSYYVDLRVNGEFRQHFDFPALLSGIALDSAYEISDTVAFIPSELGIQIGDTVDVELVEVFPFFTCTPVAVDSQVVDTERFIISQPETGATSFMAVTSDGADRWRQSDSLLANWFTTTSEVIQVWDRSKSGAPDRSVVLAGWSNIFAAWDCDPLNLVGAETEGNPYYQFVQEGGNLFYAVSMPDYYVDDLVTLNFGPGDLIYDLFGVIGFGDYGSNDSLFFGVQGDPLTDPFSSSPYRIPKAFGTFEMVADDGATPILRRSVDGGCVGLRVGPNENGGHAVLMTLPFWKSKVYTGDPLQIMPEPGMSKLLLDRVAEWFEIDLLSVGESSPDLPRKFALLTPWPNPFNASTRVQWTMDRPGQIHLRVYDLLGRQVASLVQGNFGAGDHAVIWRPGGDLATGVYLLRLESDRGVETRKAVLMK